MSTNPKNKIGSFFDEIDSRLPGRSQLSGIFDQLKPAQKGTDTPLVNKETKLTKKKVADKLN